MKRVQKKLAIMGTSLTMMLSSVPVHLIAADYEVGQTTPVFCQFYAQNQSGSWEWMSTSSASLNLGETQTFTFDAVDAEGNSLFALAGDDAVFGFQFGDGCLTEGDGSHVELDINSIKLSAEGYEDVEIDLRGQDFNVDFLAEAVSWGLQGNTSSLSLKEYLGEDATDHLKAMTSFEVEVSLEDYSFIPKVEEEVEEEAGSTTSKVLFSGEAVSEGEWGQALSLYEGSDFSVADLTENTQVAVKFEGTKPPEIILQSWSGGAEWARVSAASEKDGVAYFNYEDMVASYKAGTADYDTYGEVFPLLNAIHVGDMGAKLTVSEVALVSVASSESEVVTYNKGDETGVFCQFYSQNQGGNWDWMSPGSTTLLFDEEQTFTFDVPAGTFAIANEDASFGFQVGDSIMGDGDKTSLAVTLGQIVIKAEGYDDVIINLDPVKASYVAQEMSWGITNNSTMIDLKAHLGDDFLAHLNAITSIEVTTTLTDYAYIKKAPVIEEPEFEEGYTHPTEMRGLTAKELVADMKIGWNLGNTLDSLGGETNWGNPKTTRKMIDAIKDAGFNVVRIPITWDDNLSDDYTIDVEYLDRVETVVNYALANDMYAIINIHHSYGWNQPNVEFAEESKVEFQRIWEQVAERFKDYSDKLVFETQNEPHNGNDWTGDEESYRIVNEYNEVCYNTIRQSGGNNGERLVMMPPYAASANLSGVEAFKLPNPDDQYVAVSIHAYTPYDFALNSAPGSQSTWGSISDIRTLNNLFSDLHKRFNENGVPVVMGEFAATDKANLEDRIAFAKDYIALAKKYEIPCCWWDNNYAEPMGSDATGLFNRRTLEWIYPEIVEAMMSALESDGPAVEYDPLVVFKGEATSTSWGQALSLDPETDVRLSSFTEGTQLALTYTSENTPELILQSWSGGPGWVRVAPSKIEGGVAYFTYEDMVAAYHAELEEPSEQAFPALNRVYISDTGADLTVTELKIILPPVKVEEVKFAELPQVYPGESFNLNDYLVVLPTDATDPSIKAWASSKEAVATVDENGVLTANRSGYTTLTATTNDGDLVAEVELYVNSTLDYVADFNLKSAWDNAMTGDIIITNNGEEAIDNWSLEFVYDGDITSIWNAEIVSHVGNEYTIKNLGWNQTIPAGGTISVGFVADCSDAQAVPAKYNLLAAQKVEAATDCTATLNVLSNWENNFSAEIAITNNSEETINGWAVDFDLTGTISDGWGFTVEQDGNHYTLKNASYNGTIAPGATITVGINGTIDDITKMPTVLEVSQFTN